MMNPRSPYAAMIGQQQASAMPPPPQAQPQQIQARPMQFQRPMQQDATKSKGDGGMGMMSGMMGSMMSDENSKKEIARLESANAALTKALSPSASYPDTKAPSDGMQALGQQNAAPSHASFPDAPADRVAAQNVGLQQAAPQAQAPGPQPGQSDIRNPWARPKPPNMADLDEAYARMGQGG